ncbi:uncharacterized protein LOC109840825 [Asparagus officinalis]|uniref:uncharacterized protein LOC109840825 n=1 Tax=Asparagus officinalis TaxID=4686 RepID=UPI00098E4F7A|nr:uncharacterized protein LOC109840825 [Asparagus officinalis]
MESNDDDHHPNCLEVIYDATLVVCNTQQCTSITQSSDEDVNLMCSTSGTGYTQINCQKTPTETYARAFSVDEAKLTREVEQSFIDKRSKRQRRRHNMYESNSPNIHNRDHNQLIGHTSSNLSSRCSSSHTSYKSKRVKSLLPNEGLLNDILNVGPPKFTCPHCKTMLWYDERAEKSKKHKKPTFPLCCRKGKVKFPLLQQPPEFLKLLLSPSGGARSTNFKQNIRMYNSLFSFTSTGGRVDNTYNNGGGPYCYRLNGQNHHKIGSLKPIPGENPKYCQLYIYDTDHEIFNRMAAINGTDKLDDAIVSGLLTMLDQCNVLVQSFRMVRDRVKENELLTVQLIIKSLRSGDGRMQNMPTVSEIAGLIVGDIDETIAVRDIVVYDCKLGLSRISDLHPSFMAMQYPLLFPYGEDGFRLGVPLVGESTNSNLKRKEVTMMEYAAFRTQQRCDEGHTLTLSGKLLQTYIVDMFTCIEEDRLLWVRLNQTKLRAELYYGIKDAIFRGDTYRAQVGKRIILPSSFTGGNRYMTQNYQDAIALCRVLGNPDLFITITANPKWQEIKYALDEIGGQRPDERPDIVARVFKIKFDLLMEDLQAAAVYTVEFQKRGLSHAHILLWLHPNSKYPDSNDINKIISAEIPDRETDPVGYAAVGQYMMHGPCGIFNTISPCMREGNCSKHFPKKYVNETVIDESGFAVYRRRNDYNRWVDKNGTKLDNAYVVPYNRYLIVKYQSHINVEWCNRGHTQNFLHILFGYLMRNDGKSEKKVVVLAGLFILIQLQGRDFTSSCF